MKKISTIICLVCCYIIATSFTACSDQDAPSVDTSEVKVQLTGLDDDLSGLDIQLRNINTGSVFIEKSNMQGIATFNVTPGLYEALTSQTRNTAGNEYYSYNGTSGQITVLANQLATATIPMSSRNSTAEGVWLTMVLLLSTTTSASFSITTVPNQHPTTTSALVCLHLPTLRPPTTTILPMVA